MHLNQMASPTRSPVPPLSEDVLKFPNQSSVSGESTNTIVDGIMKSAELKERIHDEARKSLLEMHQDRMFFLREQLKFLKETEWRYKPIDELIGSVTNSENL